MRDLTYRIIESDFATISLYAANGRLQRLDVTESDGEIVRRSITQELPTAREDEGTLDEMARQLHRYLAGEPIRFTIPIDLSRFGDFTKRVLTELQKVPYGKVKSYGEIGRRLGYGNAAQAVGQALKRNPIPIVIPCHRIVRGDGSIGGFDLGPKMKIKLLALEGVGINSLRESMLVS